MTSQLCMQLSSFASPPSEYAHSEYAHLIIITMDIYSFVADSDSGTMSDITTAVVVYKHSEVVSQLVCA